MKSFFACLLLLLLLPNPAPAYIDLCPTLAKILGNAQKISVVEVTQFNRDKSAAIFKKVRDLKGTTADEPIKQQLAAPNQAISASLLEFAEPGRRAILLVNGDTAMVCTGRTWYQAQSSSAGWSSFTTLRPELALSYCGSISRLEHAIELMLANKPAIITTLPHGANDEAASFDLALNRPSFPGLLKVQRLRATLKMPAMVMAASVDPSYLIGPGPMGEEELPSVLTELTSTDPTARAEAADDLRSLGQLAAPAIGDLAKLLGDANPAVRCSAAAALSQINPKDAGPVAILKAALDNADLPTRRAAVRATGLAGPAAASLTPRLAELLADPDDLVRLASLQSLGTLGPAAAPAVEKIIPLLDNPTTAITAADTLGRIGRPASPALKKLAPMLVADALPVRWAACRAMCQIGGPESRPAAEFIRKELPKAGEFDGYNMMIYLALLGPVAKDMARDIQSAPVKQPALKPATLWAISPDTVFPWNNGGPGGPGDVVRYIYQSYVTELGDRLSPSAIALAKQIMAGTAKDVPQWCYRILGNCPADVLPIITPALASQNSVQRERAAVALGYMGSAAAPAKEKVGSALNAAPAEREKRLLSWTLREISKAQ